MTDPTNAGEVAELRQELRRVRWYVPDSESDLKERIGDWIEESHNQTDADTPQEYVETELNDLLATNPMYHAPEIARGEDGFPERCKELECPHVGGACPVLMDEIEVKWRERELEEAETSEEARQVYRRQALDVSCKLIPELLDEWDNEYANFAARGTRLLSAAEDAIADASDVLPDDADRDEAAEAVPDGGGDPGGD